jgi:transposase InsO family protein
MRGCPPSPEVDIATIIGRCAAGRRAGGARAKGRQSDLSAGNAIAERLILTLKTELVWTRDWDDVAQLREAVRDWMRKYNHERTHDSLNHKTPAQARTKNLQQRPQAAA